MCKTKTNTNNKRSTVTNEKHETKTKIQIKTKWAHHFKLRCDVWKPKSLQWKVTRAHWRLHFWTRIDPSVSTFARDEQNSSSSTNLCMAEERFWNWAALFDSEDQCFWRTSVITAQATSTKDRSTIAATWTLLVMLQVLSCVLCSIKNRWKLMFHH